MAQHDYDIANQSGANFRADLNNALDAIVSNNSGSSEPSTTFAYEWWVDTTNNLLKLRNSANNAWITLPLSITADNSTSGALTVNGNLTTTGTIDVNGQELILDADADTSITADTDDQIDIKIANADHIKIATSSGDTVLQPLTDAKDIIINQYDGNELVNFNDGGYSSFTRAAFFPEATLTDASTIAWDVSTSSVAKVTLGANRTLGAATNAQTGQFISLLIIQDGTGSRTVTFNAAYEFTGDTAPTLTTTAAKGDLFVFRYNGSKFLEVGRNLNLTLS